MMWSLPSTSSAIQKWQPATAQFYDNVEAVEAVDDHTVRITFKEPTPAWSVPFTGQTGGILPRHVFEDFNGLNARDAVVNLQTPSVPDLTFPLVLSLAR